MQTMPVKHSMRTVRNTLLQSLCLAALVACATGEDVDRRYEPDASEIGNLPTCLPDQFAVCVDINCEPADYTCAEKDQLRGMFEPRIPR
jgi:hypothetical protein